MSIYKSYTPDQLEELFSGFLIDSWSYSRVMSFARNEKNFEKEEIYGERSRSSATTVAGNAYHCALELFFKNMAGGMDTSLVELEREVFSYIDAVEANRWKLQKTTPTIEECRKAATKAASALVRNFEREKSVYLEDLAVIHGVETRCDEWLTVNGVDIPLPCHACIDLLAELEDGRTVVIDHKSRAKFSDEKELAFSCGKQAITYAKCIEARSGVRVDEVWFVENKIAANSDRSPQLRKFCVKLDEDTRKLYEALLYEPLRRMLQAVSDPDYVYLVNDSDSLTDRAELYEFWAKTMIAEVDEFHVPAGKRELIAKRQKKIRDASLAAINPRAIASFRRNAASFITYDLSNKDMSKSDKIEYILRTLGVVTQVAHEIEGYSSDTYLLEVSAGTQIATVQRFRLDIAAALNVSSVRIGENLTVYDGKSYLAVEVSKRRTADLIFDPKYLVGRRIPIGVDNFGNTVVWDLDNHSTPHMLVCGATGSGKSVSILSTIEYARLAGVDDIVIFDPKYEFTGMEGEDGITVYNDIADIEEQMKLLVARMQERAAGAGRKHKTTLVVFDEFADAVSSARSGKELDIIEEVQVGTYAPKVIDGILFDGAPKMAMKVVGRDRSLEENLKMLLQKGRSLGFRVIAATQRASVKVITGDAKVNFPVQVCFRVPREIDSKVVLDQAGAETLAGAGDGLIRSPEYMDVVRFQGFYKKME